MNQIRNFKQNRFGHLNFSSCSAPIYWGRLVWFGSAGIYCRRKPLKSFPPLPMGERDGVRGGIQR